jgi:YD repeat-containing protein
MYPRPGLGAEWGSPVQVAYDPAHRPTGAGYEVDDAGRVTKTPGRSSSSLDLSYDPLGRLIEVKSGANTLATYTYDPLDRLSSCQSSTAGDPIRPVGIRSVADTSVSCGSLAAPFSLCRPAMA